MPGPVATPSVMDSLKLPENIPFFVYPIVFLFLSLILIRFISRSPSQQYTLPPGPPAVPLIGNLHQVPLVKPYLYFSSLVKQYGDIVGLRLGPGSNPKNHLVVLSSATHVRELFDKKGTLYSDRPRYKICCDYVLKGSGGPKNRGEEHVLFMKYGEDLRRYAKAVRMLTSQKAIERSWRTMEKEARRFVDKVLSISVGKGPGEGDDDTKKWRSHLRFWALATPLRAIAGQDIDTLSEEFIEKYFYAQHEWLSLLTPGRTPPVDIFPFLRWIPEWFPGGEWKAKAREVRAMMEEAYYGFLESSRMPSAEGCLMASIRRRMGKEALTTTTTVTSPKAGTGKKQQQQPGLELVEGEDEKIVPEDRFDEDQIAYVGGSLVDAAVDTTMAAMGDIVLVFAKYPEVLRKAQREVDEVCGDRIPRGEDITKFKYLRACILEALRWRPPAPNALPHVLSKPSKYKSFSFLAGTTFIIDVWGLHHDPTYYTNPSTFDPERFLLNPLGVKPDVLQEAEKSGRKPVYTFGAGRRICPGEQFALASLVLNSATLAWAGEVKIPKGKDIDVSVEEGFIPGLVLAPKDFPVVFNRRKGRSLL